MRIKTKLVVTLLLASSLTFAQDVRIEVLGLFRPRQFTLSAPDGVALAVDAGSQTFVLEKSSGVGRAKISVSEKFIVLQIGNHTVRAFGLTVTSRNKGPVDFLLGMPGKITRHYRGTLEIMPVSGTLTAVVCMDMETAVASVVAAESMPDANPEALKAQAVAARSYFIADKSRHHNFDFCDTTHCQFLREPPVPGTPAARATAETTGLVVAYESHPIGSMYMRSCSGRTHTSAELGLTPAAYPYYSVECKYCREHPTHWQSRIAAHDAAALHSFDEAARLNIDRRLGWSTVPSNDFTMKKIGGHVILHGTGEGHGIGLCQSGANAMAKEGANFRQILSHYYPNTTIVRIGDQ